MTEDTSHLLQHYQRIIEISRDLASTLDLNSLLARIIKAAVELSHAEVASILLYVEKQQQLYFQASTDTQNEALLKGMVIPAESIAGWVAQNRQPVMVNDVHADPRWFASVEQAVQLPTQRLIAVPLLIRDRLIGVLEVLNSSGAFGQTELDTLQVLGAQAAVAIENTRLFNQADLISELVHEIRTPLSSITTITYLLQRPELAEEQRRALSLTIQQEAMRLNEMSTRFLDLARLESGRVEYHTAPVDVSTLLNECIEIMRPRADETGIQIIRDCPPGLPPVKADRDKLKQVALNLLSNAIKYNRPRGFLIVRTWSEDNQYYIAVEDTGQGIPAEALPHLFERFFRTHTAEAAAVGTGLGLSICKRIVEDHHGEITAHSKVGAGTTFTVRLPLPTA
jgi:signal transduction histidine kinase